MPENMKICAKIKIRKKGYGECNKGTVGREKGNEMNNSLKRNKKRKAGDEREKGSGGMRV